MSLEYEQRIRTWMTETASNGGVERFDDLHIDRIDSEWKDRSEWVVSALSMFSLSIGIREDLRLPLTVALVFSMHPDGNPEFDSIPALEEQLDWSPPSLYLLTPDRSFSEGAKDKHVALPSAMLAMLPTGVRSRLLEWAEGDGERRRTLIIEQ